MSHISNKEKLCASNNGSKESKSVANRKHLDLFGENKSLKIHPNKLIRSPSKLSTKGNVVKEKKSNFPEVKNKINNKEKYHKSRKESETPSSSLDKTKSHKTKNKCESKQQNSSDRKQRNSSVSRQLNSSDSKISSNDKKSLRPTVSTSKDDTHSNTKKITTDTQNEICLSKLDIKKSSVSSQSKISSNKNTTKTKEEFYKAKKITERRKHSHHDNNKVPYKDENKSVFKRSNINTSSKTMHLECDKELEIFQTSNQIDSSNSQSRKRLSSTSSDVHSDDKENVAKQSPEKIQKLTDTKNESNTKKVTERADSIESRKRSSSGLSLLNSELDLNNVSKRPKITEDKNNSLFSSFSTLDNTESLENNSFSSFSTLDNTESIENNSLFSSFSTVDKTDVITIDKTKILPPINDTNSPYVSFGDFLKNQNLPIVESTPQGPEFACIPLEGDKLLIKKKSAENKTVIIDITDESESEAEDNDSSLTNEVGSLEEEITLSSCSTLTKISSRRDSEANRSSSKARRESFDNQTKKSSNIDSGKIDTATKEEIHKPSETSTKVSSRRDSDIKKGSDKTKSLETKHASNIDEGKINTVTKEKNHKPSVTPTKVSSRRDSETKKCSDKTSLENKNISNKDNGKTDTVTKEEIHKSSVTSTKDSPRRDCDTKKCSDKTKSIENNNTSNVDHEKTNTATKEETRRKSFEKSIKVSSRRDSDTKKCSDRTKIVENKNTSNMHTGKRDTTTKEQIHKPPETSTKVSSRRDSDTKTKSVENKNTSNVDREKPNIATKEETHKSFEKPIKVSSRRDSDTKTKSVENKNTSNVDQEKTNTATKEETHKSFEKCRRDSDSDKAKSVEDKNSLDINHEKTDKATKEIQNPSETSTKVSSRRDSDAKKDSNKANREILVNNSNSDNKKTDKATKNSTNISLKKGCDKEETYYSNKISSDLNNNGKNQDLSDISSNISSEEECNDNQTSVLTFTKKHCDNKIIKTVEDNKKLETAKDDNSKNDSKKDSKLNIKFDKDVIHKIQILITEQAVEFITSDMVSVLNVYVDLKQYTTRSPDSKEVDNKDIFIKNRLKHLKSLCKKLQNAKVYSFKLPLFFDSLIESIKIHIASKEALNEKTIIRFIHNVLVLLMENCTSPDDHYILYNHVVSAKSLQYLDQKSCFLRDSTDKQIFDCMNSFSIKLERPKDSSNACNKESTAQIYCIDNSPRKITDITPGNSLPCINTGENSITKINTQSPDISKIPQIAILDSSVIKNTVEENLLDILESTPIATNLEDNNQKITTENKNISESIELKLNALFNEESPAIMDKGKSQANIDISQNSNNFDNMDLLKNIDLNQSYLAPLFRHQNLNTTPSIVAESQQQQQQQHQQQQKESHSNVTSTFNNIKHSPNKPIKILDDVIVSPAIKPNPIQQEKPIVNTMIVQGTPRDSNQMNSQNTQTTMINQNLSSTNQSRELKTAMPKKLHLLNYQLNTTENTTMLPKPYPTFVVVEHKSSIPTRTNKENCNGSTTSLPSYTTNQITQHSMCSPQSLPKSTIAQTTLQSTKPLYTHRQYSAPAQQPTTSTVQHSNQISHLPSETNSVFLSRQFSAPAQLQEVSTINRSLNQSQVVISPKISSIEKDQRKSKLQSSATSQLPTVPSQPVLSNQPYFSTSEAMPRGRKSLHNKPSLLQNTSSTEQLQRTTNMQHLRTNQLPTASSQPYFSTSETMSQRNQSLQNTQSLQLPGSSSIEQLKRIANMQTMSQLPVTPPPPPIISIQPYSTSTSEASSQRNQSLHASQKRTHKQPSTSSQLQMAPVLNHQQFVSNVPLSETSSRRSQSLHHPKMLLPKSSSIEQQQRNAPTKSTSQLQAAPPPPSYFSTSETPSGGVYPSTMNLQSNNTQRQITHQVTVKQVLQSTLVHQYSPQTPYDQQNANPAPLYQYSYEDQLQAARQQQVEQERQKELQRQQEKQDELLRIKFQHQQEMKKFQQQHEENERKRLEYQQLQQLEKMRPGMFFQHNQNMATVYNPNISYNIPNGYYYPMYQAQYPQINAALINANNQQTMNTAQVPMSQHYNNNFNQQTRNTAQVPMSTASSQQVNLIYPPRVSYQQTAVYPVQDKYLMQSSTPKNQRNVPIQNSNTLLSTGMNSSASVRARNIQPLLIRNGQKLRTNSTVASTSQNNAQRLKRNEKQKSSSSINTNNLFESTVAELKELLDMTTNANKVTNDTNVAVRNSSRDSGYMTPTTQKDQTCAYCLGVGNFLCSGCVSVYYCSEDCQTKAWPFHQDTCFIEE